MPSHLKPAMDYARRGLHIFPLAEMGKTPMVPRGFKKATSEEKQIADWWGRWENANIGIVCGLGFFILDVDGDEGRESLAQLERDHGLLPTTVTVETPGKIKNDIHLGKGLHLYFKIPDGVGVKQTVLSSYSSLETRANKEGQPGVPGGYGLLPPSIHPDGTGEYVWRNSIDEYQMATAPQWLIDLINADKPQAKEEIAPVPWDDAYGEIDNIETRARAYLETMDPAVEGQRGHDKLLAACVAMRWGFDLPEAAAMRLILEVYNPTCSPPWDMGDKKDRKEMEHKLKEGAKGNDKPKGWLKNEPIARDVIALEHGRQMARSFLANREPDVSTFPDMPADVIIPLDRPNIDLPQACLVPPGVLGELVYQINRNARSPQPLLSLAASYAFLGALFGRKIRDENDLRTNIYCMGVAETCAGKDHARRFITSLCSQAGIISDVLGGRDVTSDTAITACLRVRPSVLFLWDEMGHMISNIKDRNASSCRKLVVPMLMSLTGAASSKLLGKEFATEQRVDIEQPCVCIYGTTAPHVFYRGLSSAEISDGLLGRLIVFISLDNDPDINDANAKIRPIPDSLIASCQAWSQFVPDPPADAHDIQGYTGVYQVTIPTDDRAHEVFLDLRSTVRRKRAEALINDEPEAPLWGRVEEHARKFGLILAASDSVDPGLAVIRQAHADNACTLMWYLSNEYIRAIATNVADTDQERWHKRILQMVTESGEEGVPHRKITKATATLTGRQREDAVRSLLDSELLVRIKLNGSRSYTYFTPKHAIRHANNGE